MNPKEYVLQSPDGTQTMTTESFANMRDLLRSANWVLVSDNDLPKPPEAMPIATLPRPRDPNETFQVRSPDGTVETHSFQNAGDLARNQGWKIIGRSSDATDTITVTAPAETGEQPTTVVKLQTTTAPIAIEAAAPAAAPVAEEVTDEKPAKRKRRTKAEMEADRKAALDEAETTDAAEADATLHDVVLQDAGPVELPQIADEPAKTAPLGPSFFGDFADLSTEVLIAGAKGMEIDVDGAWDRETLISNIERAADDRLIASGDFEGIETPDASDDEEETAAKIEAINLRRQRAYLLEAERQGFEMPAEVPTFAKFIESFAATE